MYKLLDLYCGAGGAAKGYADAGFEVTGVDIIEQPRYPYKFIQAEAIDYVTKHLDEYDVIHASPPCQPFTKMSACRPGRKQQFKDLIFETRLAIESKPYVIENVPASPLIDPIQLCGWSFGRELYRHRLFESNMELDEKKHARHVKPGSRAGHWKPGEIISISGHFGPMWLAREVMEIDWMRRHEMSEAIPPYYTEFIGMQLIKKLDESFEPIDIYAGY
jgi:DNA (cytosine-5)-methyltransferase 1